MGWLTCTKSVPRTLSLPTSVNIAAELPVSVGAEGLEPPTFAL